ncbi:MAG: hypothetical protein GX556_19575 [Fibrobacter sp.]|nr:hypothetical protein [Fibrobacter sp.]
METRFKNLKRLYASIKEITEKLLDDFSDENLNRSLSERTVLLEQVKLEEDALAGSRESFNQECRSLKNEIKMLILSINQLDKETELKIKAGMEQVRSEMSKLSSKSNAALAYSAHRRS